MYTLKMDNPAYEKDTTFSVADFPVELTNGKTVKVSKDVVEDFEARTGNDFKKYAEGITGAELTATATAKKKEGDS